MPLYDYACECGHELEVICRVDTKRVSCPKCGKNMERQFPCSHGINMGASGAYGYYDPNLQTYISTNRQRREEMKRQGVSEAYGKGWY